MTDRQKRKLQALKWREATEDEGTRYFRWVMEKPTPIKRWKILQYFMVWLRSEITDQNINIVPIDFK